MTTAELIEKLERAEADGPSVFLDVATEVAMFHPGRFYSACRANSAGTKVIYTDKAGSDVTCWPQDWSVDPMRTAALRVLKAKEADNG